MSSKVNDFLSSVNQGALNTWEKHSILPSVVVSQAILESGWGGSELATKGNNLFGIKADSKWKGSTITLPTKEIVNGKKITIDAKFRKYKNWSESIEDHGLFFIENSTRYKKAIGETDYKKALTEIHKAGYATNPDYVSELIKIIEKNKLQELDNVAINSERSNKMDVTKTCRDINELKPVAQTACKLFLEECKKLNIPIFITETYRPQARQDYLYKQGRTSPYHKNNKVTWTTKSNHTGRLAWDVAVDIKGDLYNQKVINRAGAVAMSLGIEWGGSWSAANYDSPHFEVTTKWKVPSSFKPTTKPEKVKDDDNLYTPTKAMLDSTAKVLKRLEGKKNGISPVHRESLMKGKLTSDEAIGLIYVAFDRGLFDNKGL